ncbi:MAG TPA: hypothetical protein VHU17_08355 [Acidimicrobiales bacterium]|nr:hypothetical protein [Acidimicrobiales bacterium]
MLAGGLAGCTSSTQGASSETTASVGPTIPLTSSSVTGTTAWATLAMGHLDDPLNTFWQLLKLNGPLWKLATPPGVASNGGLVTAAAPESVLAAFGPSQDLQFSPLARTVDQGSTWQAGVLPAGVSLVPDAVIQGANDSLALLSVAGGKVVSATTADLSRWTPVTTASSLRRQAGQGACRLQSLTAVTLDANGSPLVGASCAHDGHAGLFAQSSGSWVSTGPAIGEGASGPTEVIRLDQTAAGTAALVSAGSGAAARLYGMWSINGLGPWTVSGGLPLNGASLRSTGVTAAGGFVVSTRRGNAPPSASVLDPKGSQWTPLRPLPSGTISVTANPAGSYDALVPVDSTLSVYGLEATGWARLQTLRVDIPFGSSG